MSHSRAPQFSVVIPSYNRAKAIRRCIESVLAQTWHNFELIVVDDNSTDDTADVVRAIASSDSRIRLIVHPKNLGACVARNTGIDAARATTVALLDSDDHWMPQKLEQCAIAIGEQPDSKWVLFSKLAIVTDLGLRTSRHPTMSSGGVADYLFIHMGSIQTSTVVLPTRLAREVRFLPRLPRLQDWDFYLRLEAAGARFVHIAQVLAVHDARTTGERISDRRDYRFLKQWIDERRHLISAKAYAAFLANKAAPEAADEGNRLTAARWLIDGVSAGATPARSALIEGLRIALPQSGFQALRAMYNIAHRTCGAPESFAPSGAESVLVQTVNGHHPRAADD